MGSEKLLGGWIRGAVFFFFAELAASRTLEKRLRPRLGLGFRVWVEPRGLESEKSHAQATAGSGREKFGRLVHDGTLG